MSFAWQDHESQRRQRKLARSQPPLWQDVALWLVSAALVAAVWITIIKLAR